jgi:hypothetical protein
MGSRIAMSCCFSTKLGMRVPQSQLGHARPQIIGSRVAISEDEDKALSGKEWLR